MPITWRSVGAACTALVLAAGVAACGSSSSNDSGSSPSGSKAASASLGSCGTIPFVKPADPNGVFKALPKSAQRNFNGYAYPLYASKWANWKPPAGKLKIGITWTQPANDFAAGTLATVTNQLKALPNVGKVTVVDGAGLTDIPAQIQQYQSLLQQKPDMIIADVTVAQPLMPLVEKAAAEGIPTISPLGTFNTADVVSVVPNTWLGAAQTTAAAVKAIGGKGNALIAQGIPGLSINTQALAGMKAVLKNCPNIKVVGTVTTNFQPSVAKAQVISFLGTHPQPINAVFGAGGVATGVISAFTSTGRPVPAVTEQAGVKGALGYWLAHKSTYKGSETGGGAVAFGSLVSLVAKKMLHGDGIKVSSVVQPQPLITSANIGQWAQPSWTLSTPGTAADPAGTYNNEAVANPLFKK